MKLDQICDDLFNQNYAVIDDFLPLTAYQSLYTSAQAMHANGLLHPAKIGKQNEAKINSSIRNDKIVWINAKTSDTAIEQYFSAINALSQAFNQAFFLGLDQAEAHFAVYPPGSFYKKHIDQFQGTQDRQISCVYYLNEQWQESDGGQLKLYDDQHRPLLELLPLGNRFVCFKSHIAHEVVETKKMRYSIAAWLKTRSLSLIA